MNDTSFCDLDVREHGEHIATATGARPLIEAFTQTLTRLSKARVDWYYVGGRAAIMALGKPEAVAYARTLIAEFSINVVEAAQPGPAPEEGATK